ncbi:lower tail fiber [Nitrososphaeria virus YSH_922147]|uniref:Lower tail fiber n=1 Tax=Nitrososphaeria virus YSH_922147 TaxID=3071323 RepID=A0A976UAR5_9CAUD|nr:lower tail fiber [Yangshan Harbor Nitrososphaeria virus]UVF62434.1 lower tail fiber [Nitrososphaeria virus YSH_922147]
MNNEDLWGRIFDKFDVFEKKLDDLCERTTRVEEKIINHMERRKEEIDKKDRDNKIIMGIIGVGFSAYAVIREFLFT